MQFDKGKQKKFYQKVKKGIWESKPILLMFWLGTSVEPREFVLIAWFKNSKLSGSALIEEHFS